MTSPLSASRSPGSPLTGAVRVLAGLVMLLMAAVAAAQVAEPAKDPRAQIEAGRLEIGLIEAALQRETLDDARLAELRARVEPIITGIEALILREQPRYGLEILQLMNAAGLDVADGTIYPLLHRMEAAGFVSAEWRIEGDQGRPRKYYAVTPQGARELKSMTEDWRELRTRIDTLVEKGKR